MNQRTIARAISAALIVTITLSGCAAPKAGSSTTNGQANENPECNAGGAALAGALLGAVLASGKNRLRGAALGAGIASLACAAFNYNAKQTKSAEQVQKEFKTANGGKLPRQNRVTRYETTMDSGGRIKPGSQMTVMSNIEVVQGTDDYAPILEEELKLRRPDGKDVTVRKKATDNGVGAFNTAYSMKMPEGVQQGEYPVEMSLFMNGQRVATRSMQMQVVMVHRDTMLAFAHQ